MYLRALAEPENYINPRNLRHLEPFLSLFSPDQEALLAQVVARIPEERRSPALIWYVT